MTMTTIRVKKDARYFSASNEPFNDKRLSWEARGLMGYLLSKPNDWEVRMTDLEEQGPAGNHKLRRMLAELRKYGYMNRIRLTVGGGKFDWITEVYESPSQNPKPQKTIIKQTSGGKSTSGSSTSGKLPDIVSTNDDQAVLSLSEISKAYESEIGLITSMIADDLQDAAKSYPLKWVLDAIHEAAVQNKRGWKYCLAILKRWREQGNQEPANKAKQPAPVHIPDMDDFDRKYGFA
jgi:DnaD/phage-associated family protein